MIAILKSDKTTTVFAMDIPRPVSEVEDDTEMLAEVILRGGLCYVLRGVQYNDHANRHELVYEQTTIYFGQQ